MSNKHRILDDDTARRLSEELSKLTAELSDFQQLRAGSMERVKKHREMSKLASEINSYFLPIASPESD